MIAILPRRLFATAENCNALSLTRIANNYRSRYVHCIGLLLLVCWGQAIASSENSDETLLNQIIATHWQWTLAQYPEMRLDYGDRSGNRLWTDMSPEAFTARYRQAGQFVQRLE